VARPGDEITAIVRNQSPRRLQFGVGYRLERSRGGVWRRVDYDYAVMDIALEVAPGAESDPEQIPLPRSLRPGRYRVVKRCEGRGTFAQAADLQVTR